MEEIEKKRERETEREGGVKERQHENNSNKGHE